MNKLIDHYNNAYHHSIDKKPINADYSASNENFKSIINLLNLKFFYRVRITKYKNTFSNGYTKNWPTEISIIDSVLKTNPSPYKIKDLNWEKMIGTFYGRELLLSILQISYYPEQDSHIKDKVKVGLELSSYATKKNWSMIQVLIHLI